MNKLLFSIFILLSVSIYGIENLNIPLNKDEKEWITANKNKNITIYLDKDRGILNYYSKGKRKGVFPNIIKVLEENTGLSFNIIDEDTEIFESSVDLGIPDIVMGVEDYKRNNKEYEYIDTPVELDGVAITRKDYPSIDFKEDNFGKKIVYEEGDQIKNKIIKKYGNLITLISKPNQKEAVEAILSKEADVYIEDYQEALKYLVKTPNNNVKLNYFSKVIKTDYYTGGKAEFQPLLDIIERIFDNKDLTMKFFHEETLSYTKNKLEISNEIQEYIKNRKKIKVFLPSFEEFPQLFYINENKVPEGFLNNYFYEIDKILGIQIEFERENIDFDVDPFILSVNGEELISENEEILITEPYTQIPLLIFNSSDESYVPYFDNLKKYRIAVVRNSFIERYLLYKGLGNNLIRFKNIREVLTAVSSKKADILIGELQQIDYFSKLYSIRDLQVAGTIQDKLELSFGIPKEDKTLYFLINSLNNEFSYRIKEDKDKFFIQKIKIAKDYKLSIVISAVSILLLSFVYNHLRKFKNTSMKLKKLTIGLVETLENANTFNDEDTGAHIKRLNKYSELLAEELKMPNYFVNEIGLYASLHDVGKIGIPDNILKKPGKLTEEEFETMKNHVEIGYNLMKDLDISPVALNIVRYHHEKWNGLGYGKGLKGEEIPIEARIVALADVYDALRQERVYKKAFTHEKSIEIIRSESGRHFDPEIVKIFIKKHKNFERIFEEN
ncbi:MULTISPECIES: HD domain-containing phosphohydrolase [Psychrilyobacter]|uniref:HD domain-containing protein n=1 Tax=Psychrilyobacter piezotolerans TaxID=2293438 RepID=A0ABX9KIH9_9FUSO|nr:MULTISPECIES: HD domain-containing phosphohydrolase [Psychrilyobacter]MCS5420606.1 HD domain-containing protein [Psychrilyobacter sp. S5]NDI77375.1 HD domain-containing protein [Psychrilyobacter piezotolerans]RDE63680.1 HD domain-containing protein [Psychrilyobacter sp. S5]REI42024.1 HD domain-containing protein [Psychrilyobacter piezotolerans]